MMHAAGLVAIALVLILALSTWTENRPEPQGSRVIMVTDDTEVRVVAEEVILTRRDVHLEIVMTPGSLFCLAQKLSVRWLLGVV